MPGHEKYFFEGLRRLGIGGNLLEAIMKSYMACSSVMEGFIRSPYERSQRDSKITPEQVADIVNGLNEYEKEAYDKLSQHAKKVVIAYKIMDAKGLGDEYRKSSEDIKKTLDSFYKKEERAEKAAANEELREIRRKIREHKESKYTDPNFGGTPISHRTHLFVYGKRNFTESYKQSHPGELGKFKDLILFVTDTEEDRKRLEDYDWWNELDDDQKKREAKNASKEHVIFAMRTDVVKDGNVVTVNDIKDAFEKLMSGEPISNIVDADKMDNDHLFAGFGRRESSGRAEANRVFRQIKRLWGSDYNPYNKGKNDPPEDLRNDFHIEDLYEEVKDINELNGFTLESGDRERTEHGTVKAAPVEDDKTRYMRKYTKQYFTSLNAALNRDDVDVDDILKLLDKEEIGRRFSKESANVGPAILVAIKNEDGEVPLSLIADRAFGMGKYSDYKADETLMEITEIITKNISKMCDKNLPRLVVEIKEFSGDRSATDEKEKSAQATKLAQDVKQEIGIITDKIKRHKGKEEQPRTDKETSGESKIKRAFDKYINIVKRDNLDEDGQMELFDKIAEDENLDENETEELNDMISCYFDGK